MKHIAVLISVVLSAAAPAQAQLTYPGRTGSSSVAPADRADRTGQVTFSPAARNLIRAHLLNLGHPASRPGGQDLPPGLRKKVYRGRSLPPGWQKKVIPGRSLDYHVYRQGESLPDALLKRLPPPPSGAEILQIEDKIVLLNSTTRYIFDAFDLKTAR